MKPVIANEAISVDDDMNKKELQIETKSKLGSADHYRIEFASDTGVIGNIQITFDTRMGYHIGYCTLDYGVAFDREPIITVPSIWRIQIISRTRISIWCNDLLVLTYLFENADNWRCLSRNPQTITKFSFVKLGDEKLPESYKTVDFQG